MNLKVVIGALVQWAIRLAVSLMKKKANAETNKQLKAQAEKRKKEIDEKEKVIRQKYDLRRSNTPNSWE